MGVLHQLLDIHPLQDFKKNYFTHRKNQYTPEKSVYAGNTLVHHIFIINAVYRYINTNQFREANVHFKFMHNLTIIHF